MDEIVRKIILTIIISCTWGCIIAISENDIIQGSTSPFQEDICRGHACPCSIKQKFGINLKILTELDCASRKLRHLNIKKNTPPCRRGDKDREIIICPSNISVIDFSHNRVTKISSYLGLLQSDMGLLSTVKELYLQFNRIYYISSDAFTQMEVLEKLDLSYNNIKTVPQINMLINLKYLQLNFNARLSTFVSELPQNVKQLYLSHNRLGKITRSMMRNLSSLIFLDMSDYISPFRSGRVLEKDAFKDLSSLQILNISNTRWKRISARDFSSMKNLRILRAKGLNLHHDIQLSDVMPLLEEADLSHSTVNTTSILEGHFFKLKFLDISETKLDVIHANSFQKMPNLEFLKMRWCRLRFDSAKFLQHLQNLKHIDLCFNGLPQLPQLNNALESIEVRGNQIEMLRSNVLQNAKYLTNLVIVDQYLGNIQTNSFLNATSLTKLNLKNNKLKHLYLNMFLGANNLATLNLRMNEIASIDRGAFNGLIFLKTLDLSDNNITRLDFGWFSNFQTMDSLRLQINRIKFIGNHTFQNSSIRNINLSKNQLKVVSRDAFHDIQGLTELNLSENEFKKLILPHNMTSLEQLKLSYNLFNTIPDNMFAKCCGRLEVLLLDNNMISNITDHAFHGLNHIHKLDLTSNKGSIQTYEIFREMADTLKYLYIPDTHVTSFLDIRMKNLLTFDASVNNITNITGTPVVDLVPKITTLDISYNKIIYVEEGVLDGLEIPVHRIDMKYNEFKCYCDTTNSTVGEHYDWQYLKNWLINFSQIPGKDKQITEYINDSDMFYIPYSCELEDGNKTNIFTLEDSCDASVFEYMFQDYGYGGDYSGNISPEEELRQLSLKLEQYTVIDAIETPQDGGVLRIDEY